MGSKVNKAQKSEVDARNKLIYGTLGIVMSVVGFLVWVWAFMEKTNDHLLSFLSFGRMFGISALQFLPDSLVGIVVTKALLVGLSSTLLILISLWGIGYWKGENKLSIQEFITQIGNSHYYIGVGFLIASATVFIDWKLSIGVILLNLLVGVLLLFTMAANIFSTPAKKIFSYVSLSFGAYFILLVLIILLIF